MGNQHGIPENGFNPQQAKNPRSNVSHPPSRYDSRVGSPPPATSGTELEWATPPTSPRRVPPHSLRAALSPSILFATALPHVGSTPPTSTEFETSTDAPLRQSTHVWRQQGTSGPKGGAPSSSAINGGSSYAEKRWQSDGNHNDAVVMPPSHSSNIRFRNTNSATEGVDNIANNKRQQHQFRRQPQGSRFASSPSADPSAAGRNDSANHTYGNHSSRAMPLSPSSINHAPNYVPSSAESIPGMSSCGADTRLRAEKQEELQSTALCRLPNHTDAAYPFNSDLHPAVNYGASSSSHHHHHHHHHHQQEQQESESELLHRSVSPPIRLQTSNIGLNGQMTGGRHLQDPFVADKSSLIASSPPLQSVVLQRSMSPPIRLQQPTAAPSVGAFRSMPLPNNHPNRLSPVANGAHRSMPSAISPQPPSFQRATSPLTDPPTAPPHHHHQQSSIQQRRAPSSTTAVEAGNTWKETSHLTDDKATIEKLSAVSAATSGFSRRPFSSSSVFQQHQQQSPAPSGAVSSTTLQPGSERTAAIAAYGRRQEASPSLLNHDQTPDQRSPEAKYSTNTTGRTCDNAASYDQNISSPEPSKIKTNTSGSLHSHQLMNEESRDHPKRASSASEGRWGEVEGRASLTRSRRSESSERSELGMVREGIALVSTSKMRVAQTSDRGDTLPPNSLSGSTSSPLHIIKDDVNFFSSSTSLSATCSSGRQGGTGRADSLPNQLADHSRKSSLDSDISISDSRDGSQHLQHLCSSASEISAMEERRRRRAALVRSRARNAPPTVNETPLDTETTGATDQFSKDVGTKETHFEDKASTILDESGLRLGTDSNQLLKELPANSSKVLLTPNVSEFVRKQENVVIHEAQHTMLEPNVSEIKSPVIAEKITRGVNRSNETAGRGRDKEATRVNFLNPDDKKKTFSSHSNSSGLMYKPLSLTAGSTSLGGSLTMRQTIPHKLQLLESTDRKRQGDDHLDSSISEEQPDSDLKSKEIVEGSVIVNLVQVKNVGQQQDDGSSQRTSESLVAGETVKSRNLKIGAAQLLATERVELEVAETIGLLPLLEQAFVTTVHGEILEHLTPTYQAFCFLVNRWMTKPPHRPSVERVDYEVEECLCPPSQLQQQAFASAIDDRAFESLTSNLSGQGNVLIRFVASHSAPRSKEPKGTKTVNAVSKHLTQPQQSIAGSTVSVIGLSPAEPKVAAVVFQKKTTSTIKTSEKTSTAHAEGSASVQLKLKPLQQIASKEQIFQTQSSAATADEKDILECLPLIKKPLEYGNNEGKCQTPMFTGTSEKSATKQEAIMQTKDEDPVQVQKMGQQSTMKVIVPGWEKFKAVDASGRSDKSAVPNVLPLVQQRQKLQAAAPIEKSTESRALARPQPNLLEEQKNQMQTTGPKDATTEQTLAREEQSGLIKTQCKEGQYSAGVKAQAFKSQQQSKVSSLGETAFAGTDEKFANHQMARSTKSSDSKMPAITSSLSSPLTAITSSLSSSLTANAQRLDYTSSSDSKTSVVQSVDLQKPQGNQQILRASQQVHNALQTSKSQSMTECLSGTRLATTASVFASDTTASSGTQDKESTVKSGILVCPLKQDEIRDRTEKIKGDRLPLSHQMERISADVKSDPKGLQKGLNESKQVSSSYVKTSFSQETTRAEAMPNEGPCPSCDLRSTKTSSMARSLDSGDILRLDTNPSVAKAPDPETPAQPISHRKPVLQKAKTFDVPESRPEDGDEDDEVFHLIIKRGPSKSDEDASSESTKKRISVAERIFKMESKSSGAEGDSPRSSTELSTPVKKQNLFREKSVSGSPLQKKPDSDNSNNSGITNRSSMSEQLQQHLSLIAAAAEKSSADQSTQLTADQSTQSQSKMTRRITLPVTTDEIQKAERVQSVSTFRAEVLRQAAINVYKPPVDQPEKPLSGVKVKGQELFPTHFEKEKLHDRRRNTRYRTTPVTSHELYDIPEGSPQQQSRGPKPMDTGPMSRLDPYYNEGSPSQQRNLADTRGQDYPVRTIYNLGEENICQEEGLDENQQWIGETSENGVFYEERSHWTKEERTKAQTEDELCKLSLAEKLKLFSDKPESSSSQLAPSGGRKKQRRLQSRFKTQSLDEEPITTEEVGKAKISPLAMSLVKPPPVEVLRSLPLKEQREFMAQWAEMTLAQASSSSSYSSFSSSTKSIAVLSSESASSQAESVEEETSDDKKKGILKSVSETSNRQPASGQIKGILKPNTGQQMKPKGILKTENAPIRAEKKQMQGILKKDSLGTESEGTGRGMQKMDSRSEQLNRKESPMETKTLKDDPTLGELPAGALSSGGGFQLPPQQTAIAGPTCMDAGTAAAAKSSSVARETEVEADESSSASSDTTYQNRIKNKAILRRQVLQRQLAGRPKTPPNESSDNSAEPVDDEFVPCPDKRTLTFGRNGRHFTQPITPMEKEKMESSVSKSDNDDVRASPTYKRLSQRVLTLQKSGETDWKRRLEDSRDSSSPEDSAVVLRDKKDSGEGSERPRLRPTSIADRLSLLHSSKETWRDKVEEKDIKLFTVEGKMSRLGVSVDSPLQQRSRKPGKLPITRAVSTPNLSFSPDDLLDEEDDRSEADDGMGPSTVAIPVIDNDAIARFFSSSTPTGARLNLSQADLDNISRKTRTLPISMKSVRPNRTRPASRNPLRATLEHPGLLQTYYTEVKTGVAERELKRIKHEQILGTTHFAQEALAGLASKENFSNITLRKAESSIGSTQHQPFCEVMLLHVKGRRYCQTRLVEPSTSSVNSGDCFILVTPETIILWIGEYCNIIEKAKATDVANQILQKRDLGIRSSCRLVTIPEEYQDAFVETRLFWQTLGDADPPNSSAQPPGGYSEDELYEVYISETNAVYRIKDQRLTPVEEFHGKVLKFEMLRSKEAYIFDFGTEMYVWTGKHVPFDKRKKIVQLALELWNKGYNYSEFDINPFAPLASEDTGGLPSLGNERPAWAVFGKINQNMETVLFKEKFVDWPDSSRLIQVKGQEGSSKESKAETVIDLKPFDAKLMIPIDISPVSLVLEGSHLGRGSRWEGFEKGIRREVDIITQGIDIWHVMEFDHYLLDDSSLGQLHDGDTYVIRWHYIIAQTGSKTIRSDDPRSVLGGRVRCAYFFWQGRNSSINEKGASALMTVELDEERGPQIRVVQGKESPCFLNLFKGRMIVHIGKREDESTNTHGQWRFYMVRNELPNEAYLLEIPLQSAQLRSRGSFLLLNVNTGLLFLWHGVKTTNQTVLRAREIALSLRERCPAEVGLCTDDPVMPFEMMEGHEHAEFWNALQNNESGIYDTLVQDPRPYSFNPRLFHLTSISGAFEATEIVNPARNNINIVTSFPVLQSDMYNASQPALFLLDNHHEVYLWQGWWSAETEEEADNVRTASAEARFLANRRCAMQTVLQYCREIDQSNPPPAYIVYAGLEPVVFTNIFPVWETREAITNAMLNDGKVGDDLELVEDALAKLTDVMYSWDELQRRPLPDGVDPLKLETYLSQEEFEEVIGMNQEDFNALPNWKQVNIKKEVGLY